MPVVRRRRGGGLIVNDSSSDNNSNDEVPLSQRYDRRRQRAAARRLAARAALALPPLRNAIGSPRNQGALARAVDPSSCEGLAFHAATVVRGLVTAYALRLMGLEQRFRNRVAQLQRAHGFEVRDLGGDTSVAWKGRLTTLRNGASSIDFGSPRASSAFMLAWDQPSVWGINPQRVGHATVKVRCEGREDTFGFRFTMRQFGQPFRADVWMTYSPAPPADVRPIVDEVLTLTLRYGGRAFSVRPTD